MEITPIASLSTPHCDKAIETVKKSNFHEGRASSSVQPTVQALITDKDREREGMGEEERERVQSEREGNKK